MPSCPLGACNLYTAPEDDNSPQSVERHRLHAGERAVQGGPHTEDVRDIRKDMANSAELPFLPGNGRRLRRQVRRSARKSPC